MAVLKCGTSAPVTCYTAYQLTTLAALAASALEQTESSLLTVNKGIYPVPITSLLVYTITHGHFLSVCYPVTFLQLLHSYTNWLAAAV